MGPRDSAEVATAYEETDPAWVDASYSANAGLEGIRDGKEFVLLSERDGWRQAYVISRDGKQRALLTKDTSDVIARGPVVDLVRISDHHSERILQANEEVRTRASPLITRPTEFLKLDIGQGDRVPPPTVAEADGCRRFHQARISQMASVSWHGECAGSLGIPAFPTLPCQND